MEAERRNAQEAAADAQVMRQIAPLASTAVTGVYNNWDGKSDGYAAGVQTAYEAAIKPVLDALPEQQRQRLEPGIRAQGNSYFASALAAQSKAQSAAQVGAANDSVSAATNMVLGNPDAYQAAGVLLEQASQALPGPLREAYLKDGREQLLMARLGGLVRAGKTDQVQAELADADTLLKPESKSRVLSMMASEERKKTAADYAASAATESRMAAHLDSIGTDHELPPPSDSEIEAAGGPKALADFRRQPQLHKDVGLQVADFDHLSATDMNARIDAMQSEVAKGGPEYDIHSAVLDLAVKARDAQLKARAKDPAAWAMSGDGSANDPGQVVQQAWMAVGEQRTPQAFAAYAAATIARQKQVGIASPSLLRADDAKAMLEPLQNAKDEVARGDALLGLIGNVSLAGQYRGQMLGELSKQGLSSQDALVIGELGDNPVMARDYAKGGPAWKAMKPKEQKELTAAVTARLSKFEATLNGGAATAAALSDRREVVARTAAGYMAAGESEGQAVRRAAGEYDSQYTFVDTWRMPARLAQQKHDLGGRTTFLLNKEDTGVHMVNQGTWYIQNYDLKQNNGAMLSDRPADAIAKLNLIQRQGKWFTTEDDTGLQLMVPDQASGRWQVVTDRAGKPLSYTFDQLINKTKAPYGKR